MNGYIHSIESCGTVDGPGIRYVVFMQGCPMRCKYCHNPDTWSYDSGRKVTVDEIMDGWESCKEFLNNGGITVTGGEPLMQIEFVTELFEEAKRRGVHTCLDTSGITFSRDRKTLEQFDRLLNSTDIVMLDIKHIDNEKHIDLTGQDNTAILNFAKYISEKGVEIWVRHVVVPNITDNEEYLFQLGFFIGGLRTLKALDVLHYHDMGKAKYEQLGMEYPLADTPPLTKAEAAKARDIIMEGIKSRLRENKNGIGN
ncbi:MAG: pyruvate formate lyase-activating protein [Oscillospiraceae bacterium]|nr:pyruvate formate lyase-activating protein [Oscillospiraceae bacterium]